MGTGMTTIADVLSTHTMDLMEGWNGTRCDCGIWFDYGGEQAEHLASVLEEAGFGFVAGVRELAEKMAALCPDDDWPESGSMADAVIADTGRAILAQLDGTETE